MFITSCSSKITVIYQDYDGRVLKEEKTKKESDVTAPSASEKEGYVFICWTKEELGENVIIMKPEYERLQYKVEFKDFDGNTIKFQNVFYKESAESPVAPEKEGYTFMGWDKEFTNVFSLLLYSESLFVPNSSTQLLIIPLLFHS